MEITEPYSPEEFAAYYNTRWELLRKPWGLPKGSEIDDFENISLHVIAKKGNEVTGVGRLTYFPSLEGQLRYMGVHEKYRNQKVGTQILEYLEIEAKKMGLESVFLNAREQAVDFYKANGYVVQGEPYKGFADILHYKMSKKV